MFSLDDDDLPTGGSDSDWLEGVVKANFKTDAVQPHPYRLFGNVFVYAQHNVRWFSKKKGAETGYPRLCPRHNPLTGKLDRVGPDGQPIVCAECDREGGSKARLRYLVHAIDRTLQSYGMPNPVKVLDLPESVMIAIQAKKKTNVHDGKQYSMAHPVYGRDIYITYKASAPPAQMYEIDKGDSSTPLTQQELQLPQYDFVALYNAKGLSQADPVELKHFLQRVNLIGGGAPRQGAQMPANMNLDSNELPASWGGPAQQPSGPVMGQGGFGGGGFQPPQQTVQQGGFQPQFQGGGFTPPTGPAAPGQAAFGGGGFQPPQAATEAGPSARFSGPPQGAQMPQQMPAMQQMPAGLQPPQGSFQAAIAGPGPVTMGAAAQGLPACFKVEDKMGLPGCMKCPVKDKCLND